MGILEDKRRARLFYRMLSPIYDRVNPFIWTPEMRAEALELLGIDASDQVLDVGCGTGFGTEGLLQYTQDVYGIDQSQPQLSRARAKLGEFEPVSFFLGDAERLPFEQNTFDIVWSSGSIEYWPEPVRTLEEMKRVTRPGGRVLVVGPNTPRTRIMRAIAKAIMLFYDEEEAERMFTAAGYTDISHHLMGPSYNPEIAITTIATVPN